MTRETADMSDQGEAALTRVFSGIQPTGELHLGNYLGAIQNWVERQDERESFLSIVDLHAITVYQDPDALGRGTRQTAAMLLACGIDPERSTLFVQSHVRAHAEASWLLTCVTPLGWLQRMTQYKAKAAAQEAVLTGLLTYPVLQAGDILLYDADEVPVGEDQKQHVELCRDIAQSFNHTYGETFQLPQPVIPRVAARVMGFDDPSAKMSKSAKARGHAVRLADSEEEILRTIRRAVTDSGREIVFSDDPEKAGVDNLLTIYRKLTGRGCEQVLADFADARGYGDLKNRVAEVVIESLRPIQRRFRELMADRAELDRLLARGAEKARAVAEPKVVTIKERLGFVVPDALRHG